MSSRGGHPSEDGSAKVIQLVQLLLDDGLHHKLADEIRFPQCMPKVLQLRPVPDIHKPEYRYDAVVRRNRFSEIRYSAHESAFYIC